MKTPTLLLVTLFALSAVSAFAQDPEPLTIPSYNMTKANYVSITQDSKFDTDFYDYAAYIYNISYQVTSRVRRITSGTLTLTFDVNQTEDGWLGKSTKSNTGVYAIITIGANKATGISFPGASLEVQEEALRKVLTAYVNIVLPTELSLQVALTEQLMESDTLQRLSATAALRFKVVPDTRLRLHNFTSELKAVQGISGKINFLIDGYSPFMSYTPRFRGKVWIITDVPVTIELKGDPNAPLITVDWHKVKPFAANEVEELIKGFYTIYAKPLVLDLFA